jgi:hypothetical protein
LFCSHSRRHLVDTFEQIRCPVVRCIEIYRFVMKTPMLSCRAKGMPTLHRLNDKVAGRLADQPNDAREVRRGLFAPPNCCDCPHCDPFCVANIFPTVNTTADHGTELATDLPVLILPRVGSLCSRGPIVPPNQARPWGARRARPSMTPTRPTSSLTASGANFGKGRQAAGTARSGK